MIDYRRCMEDRSLRLTRAVGESPHLVGEVRDQDGDSPGSDEVSGLIFAADVSGQKVGATDHREPVSDARRYSERRATVGSTLVARSAGM